MAGKTTSSRPKTTSSRPKPAPPRPKATPPPPPRNQKRSPLRRAPPLDTALAWGDAVTVACTELASDRVRSSEVGTLSAVLVIAIVCAAAAKGDYAPRSGDASVFARQRAMLRALADAASSWVLALPVSLAADAALVKYGFLTPSAFLPNIGGLGSPPPQAEVLVAVLATLASWRGIYYGLKPFL